jgi:tetratricopeptide (TPR) repeat protein
MNKEDIATWTTAAKLYEQGGSKNALNSFSTLRDYSKVNFNIGVIHQGNHQHDTALEYFDTSLTKDAYFALALFQRAYSLFLLEEYDLALDDLDSVVELLLDNDYIDYAQLGMTFKLYKCEALYNRGLVLQQIGDELAGTRDIQAAQKVAITDAQLSTINEAVRLGPSDQTLYSLPKNMIFTIPESKAKNLKPKTFLHKPTVVSNTKEESSRDSDAGKFSGAVILKNSNAKPRAVLASSLTPIHPMRKASMTISPPASPTSSTSSSMASISSRGSSLSGIKIEMVRRNSPAGLSSPLSPTSPTLSDSPTYDIPAPKFKLRYSFKGEKYISAFDNSAHVDDVYQKIERKLKVERIVLSFDIDGDSFDINDNEDLEIAKECETMLLVELTGSVITESSSPMSPSPQTVFDAYF